MIHSLRKVAGLLALLSSCRTTAAAVAALSCQPAVFSIPPIFGLQVVEIYADPVLAWHDYLLTPDPLFPLNPGPIDFCNVTVAYTHPGLNDTIHATIWLPLSADTWNGRLLAVGGGGTAPGLPAYMGPSVAQGYAGTTTDAGVNIYIDAATLTSTTTSWSLRSPGNVDLVALQNFASRAFDDLPKIAKAVTAQYYGKPAHHSYFQGCSGGGRQAMMSVQRYPDNYDGILAGSPAINYATFIPTAMYTQLTMNRLGYYPATCEFRAITAAAVKACDLLDDIEDNIISAPALCNFDAMSAVGEEYDCNGEKRIISKEAAQISNAAWTGPFKNGTRVWFGVNHDAPIATDYIYEFTISQTQCDSNSRNCTGFPFPISVDWYRQFLAKDPEFDVKNITFDNFFDYVEQSRREYLSIIDTSDIDLSGLQRAGGKVILYHGLADPVIAPSGTISYYDRVRAVTPDIEDFFRFFELPGIHHCTGGPGAFPTQAMNKLVEWVENSEAPDTLVGQTTANTTRLLCLYPKVATLRPNAGNNTNDASSYVCSDSFDQGLIDDCE